MSPAVDADILARVKAVRWHHKFEVLPGVVTDGTYSPAGLWKRLRLGNELAGKRVLDIGARDGYFSFQCEALGANVLAVDYVAKEGTGFSLAAELRQSRVEFLNRNIYDLRPSDIGTFDYVLMLGLLYHLPDPYLALEIVRSLVKPGGTVLIESTCIDHVASLKEGTIETKAFSHLPVMMFVARNLTSFWDLNSECLRQLLEHTGFAVRDAQIWGKRMLMRAEAIEDAHVQKTNVIARGVVERG
jgi:tRNA (mo5U34)-methyltransferase